MQHPDPMRIKRVTEKIIGLPTLPTVVSKMIELVDNPRTSASSLANLISTDQALTARILKLSNSAYYGFPREIYTVNMAIIVMGFNAVKEMGLSLSVFDMFKDMSAFRYFDVQQYWHHCIACGTASKMIARKYNNSIAAEAFVAGLLHDIGKVVLSQYLHVEFERILKSANVDKQKFDDAEMAIIGTTHGEIGSWLADKWRLPMAISDAIRYHHVPWKANRNELLVAFINLGNYLVHISGVGSSGRPYPEEIDDRTWRIFENNNVTVDLSDIDTLLEEYLLELDKTDTLSTFFTD